MIFHLLGTLEYASRDAHLGCVSRRGDIEVLLYVLIDWLGGKLPWDTDEPIKPSQIHSMKIEAFHDIKGFLSEAFKISQSYPTFLEDLMNLVKKLRFEEAPDYDYVRSLFRPYLTLKRPLFENKNDSDEVSLCIQLGNDLEQNNDLEEEDEEVTISKPMMRKPSKRRSLPLNLKRQQSLSQPWSPSQMQIYSDQKNEIIRDWCVESLKNPTPAMRLQLARMQKRSEGGPSVAATSRRKG